MLASLAVADGGGFGVGVSSTSRRPEPRLDIHRCRSGGSRILNEDYGLRGGLLAFIIPYMICGRGPLHARIPPGSLTSGSIAVRFLVRHHCSPVTGSKGVFVDCLERPPYVDQNHPIVLVLSQDFEFFCISTFHFVF